MNLSRRALFSAAAAPLLQTAQAQRNRRGKRTNVVMFMTDDHGAWATSVYG